MTTFQELYRRLVKDTIQSKGGGSIAIKAEGEAAVQLDCLLRPQQHPLVWRLGNCDCSPEEQDRCAAGCDFEAVRPGKDGSIAIDNTLCVGCGICIDRCHAQKLMASKDIIPALNAICSGENLVYALVAPAFYGQFGPEVTPGRLRTALKRVGFYGMVEVALFADILTLKEALEFDRNIQKESDYQLTSCCCPMWIAMIRKVYHQLMPYVPGSVSPMIASGRMIKSMHPEAVTVFIGPCIAKKSEAREADLAGAVDFVLTFQEVQDIFDAMEIDPVSLEESESDHSSRAGRIYARNGGVSEAVKRTVEHLNPQRTIQIRTQQADGVVACKAMLNDLLAGKTTANFFEGMGCVGGCVGGPKAIIDRSLGRENVETYGNEAIYATPVENPNVTEMLHQLGFDTVESLLEHSDLFTRKF